MKNSYLIAGAVAAAAFLIVSKKPAVAGYNTEKASALYYSDPFSSMATLTQQIAEATQRNTDYTNGTAWRTNGNGTPSFFGMVNP